MTTNADVHDGVPPVLTRTEVEGHDLHQTQRPRTASREHTPAAFVGDDRADNAKLQALAFRFQGDQSLQLFARG